MTLVFITSTLGYGGAAKMLAFAANSLVCSDINIHVLAYSCTYAIPKFEDKIHIHYLGAKLKSSGHLKKLHLMFKEIKKISPDVIVSFLTFPNMYSVILGKLLKIPVIISERGNPFTNCSGKMRVVYSIINRADGAVFQTEGAKCFFSQRLRDRSIIIPNPVVKRNEQALYDLKCCNHQIVSLGRLENQQKRIDVLFEALGYVVREFQDAKLIIYGTGDDETMLKVMASKYPYAHNIEFRGKTSDPEGVMSQSEVFVLSSDYEGIPNSLIEAMSIGMPVVATDCEPGGARLLIQDGDNGFLVPRADPKAIGEKILVIFENYELKKQLSINAQKIMFDFSQDKVANMWKEFIKGYGK